MPSSSCISSCLQWFQSSANPPNCSVRLIDHSFPGWDAGLLLFVYVAVRACEPCCCCHPDHSASCVCVVCLCCRLHFWRLWPQPQTGLCAKAQCGVAAKPGQRQRVVFAVLRVRGGRPRSQATAAATTTRRRRQRRWRWRKRR